METKKIDWGLIQRDYDENELTLVDVKKKYKIYNYQIKRAKATGKFKARPIRETLKIGQRKVSRERRVEIMNKARKNGGGYQYFNGGKKISYPEKFFKEKLNGTSYKHHHPISLYELDFADLERKIDFEVDGELHFTIEKNRKRDIRRNIFLTELGWTVIRVRWSIFNQISKEEQHSVIESIKKGERNGSRCYLYIDKNSDTEKIKEFQKKEGIKGSMCPKCKNKKSIFSKTCRKCNTKILRKEWPKKEELSKLVNSMPIKFIAEKFNTSIPTVRKWMNLHKIKNEINWKILPYKRIFEDYDNGNFDPKLNDNWIPPKIKDNFCCDCGKKATKKAKRCYKCNYKNRRSKIKWPSKVELEKMIKVKTFTEIASEMEVVLTSVKNRCDYLGIEYPKGGFPRGRKIEIKPKDFEKLLNEKSLSEVMRENKITYVCAKKFCELHKLKTPYFKGKESCL